MNGRLSRRDRNGEENVDLMRVTPRGPLMRGLAREGQIAELGSGGGLWAWDSGCSDIEIAG